MDNIIYGATPDEWDHWQSLLGARDLLPVVSNPHAVVSSTSNLVDVGKVPSQYTKAKQVVGISGWTTKEMTPANVERFKQQPDYGICIQTRLVRGIDIDVTDVFVADDIEQLINDRLGVVLPARRRCNSSKCLLGFKLDGEWGKRRVEVTGGVVEILMNGQQFIAIGTHPSGVRYEWDGGLPDEVPVVGADAFESLWTELVETFGVGANGVSVYKERNKGLTVIKHDPVKDWLVSQGLVIGSNAVGDVFVDCPWKSEHSDPDRASGTATVWMVAGGNGYEQGHFNCKHAHCVDRTDDEFIDAVGARLVVDQEVIDLFPTVSGSGDGDGGGSGDGGGDGRVAVTFRRNDKTGEILPDLINIIAALRESRYLGIKIGLDNFREEIMVARDGTDEWISFTDNHYVEIWLGLVKKGFKELDHKKIKHAVLNIASANRFDSASLWLSGLQWDGIKRVDKFLMSYMGADDSPYVHAVSRYMWTGLAGRIMQPGVKADMVPVFIGEQGAGKSSAIAALSPSDEFFAELSLADRDVEISRKIRGKMIVELPELKGLKGRDMEHTKALITRTQEEWRQVYREYNSKYYRRNMFFGSTNDAEFLFDVTGNRRWLPLSVGVKGVVDIVAIKSDRLQLWAEARELFVGGGVAYAEAELLARDVHADHMISDSWIDLIEPYIKAKGDFPVNVHDVLVDCLKFMSAGSYNRGHEMRVADIFRKLGLTKKRHMKGGMRHVYWQRD